MSGAMPLPYVDLAAPLVPREWLVLERIPLHNVTLLSGDGGLGKSLLLMQLAGAVALGGEWIGTLPERGSVLYLSCEEDDDEIRRRMEDVAASLGSNRVEMEGSGLRFVSLAGKDAILGQPDRNGIIRPTPLFERLCADALERYPKLVVLDTAADVFGGNEVARAQTRQFITMLRGLATDAGAAVVIAAHPSLTGLNTDSGLSGSTAWHNSVRARMYFKAAPGDDNTLRVLECRKNNYGPINDAILLRWVNGVYVPEPRLGSLERMAAEEKIDHLFIKLLRRFTEQGRNVSDKPSPTFAPKIFAEQPDAKSAKINRNAFAAAMERLFATGKIAIATVGPASHRRSHLVEASNALSNSFQPPSNGVFQHTPYNPPPVGTVGRALERLDRPNGQKGLRSEHGDPADDLWPDLPRSLDRNRPALGPVGDSLDDLKPLESQTMTEMPDDDRNEGY
jgi:RecA-family ATPase